MVKIGSFWGQIVATGQNLEKLVKKFFLKMFLKIISVRFMDINLVKNVIHGGNLVKIGRFGENGQNWVTLGPKWRLRPKFMESVQKIFSKGF